MGMETWEEIDAVLEEFRLRKVYLVLLQGKPVQAWATLRQAEQAIENLGRTRKVHAVEACGGWPIDSLIEGERADAAARVYEDMADGDIGLTSIQRQDYRDRAATIRQRLPSRSGSPAPVGPKKPEYEPASPHQRLSYLVEECGEVYVPLATSLGRVLAAAGKCLRWGYAGFNPELPEEDRETNASWLRRELGDLQAAIVRVQRDIHDHPVDPRDAKETLFDTTSERALEKKQDSAGEQDCG